MSMAATSRGTRRSRAMLVTAIDRHLKHRFPKSAQGARRREAERLARHSEQARW